MAMRARGDGVNPSHPTRPRTIVGHVYEQFKPMSEWRQEDDYDTLLVYLPGFQKEYIKVTTEDRNILRVRGERLVAGNKWSRFVEDFQIPENCEKGGIRAKFDGGILAITMPREIVNAPKTEEQPFRRTKQEEASLKPKEESEGKSASSPTGGKGKEPLKSDFPTTGKPITPQTSEGTFPPQLMPTSLSKPTKQDPLKSLVEEKPEKKSDGGSTSERLPLSLAKGKAKQDATQKITTENEPRISAGIMEKNTSEKITTEDNKAKYSDDVTGKSKIGDIKVTTTSFETDKLEKYKKVAKELARGGKNEERELLVNIGVAVLVIVALGAYVSYTIGSSGKAS